MKKDTILTYTITKINASSDIVYGKKTYNNNISLREEPLNEIVRKTDEYISFHLNEPTFTIEGNLLIQEEEHLMYSIYDEISLQTGWMVYSSYCAMGRFANSITHYNISLEILEDSSSFPDALVRIGLFLVVSGLFVVVLFVNRRKISS